MSGPNPEKPGAPAASGARERLINAAYDLFANHGIAQVGIERILDQAGCAKASLYNHFKSKSDLALAFLDRREERWTHNWLEDRIKSHEGGPEDQLLFIFDVFDDWFRSPDFEGCSFINVLLESEKDSPVRRHAADQLARIRDIIRRLAADAKLDHPDVFAQSWHMLMKGSIISAGEGNQDAAQHARRAAQLVLQGWPRTAG